MSTAESATLLRIQSDLREARETMVSTLDAMTQRGARLDTLVSKAGELTAFSSHYLERSRLRGSLGGRRLRVFLGATALLVAISLISYIFLCVGGEQTTKFETE